MAIDSKSQFDLQTNQAAIDTGAATVKTFFLLNGGAINTLLAFLGALAGTDRISGEELHKLAGTLVYFTVGVALAAASGGSGYIVNLSTAENALNIRKVFQCVAIAAGVLSLASFCVGAWQVQASIQTVKFEKPVSNANERLPQKAA